ncbi:hypothetical protein BUE80_DR002655 [Diplocarpon rosae]|nr:hypothetical protein BUE80_DR002655 [Diplocarpon rosae]
MQIIEPIKLKLVKLKLLSGHISEKCFKLHPELRPQNQKAKKAKESKTNSSKTLISAWNSDSSIAS